MNAPLIPRMATQTLTASDGVRLAAYCWGDSRKPPLVLVHGYPDSHRVWQPLAERLAARYYVIAYDVRGAGASDRPTRRRDYRLEQLSRDLQTVIDALSPDRAVHLIAHDWGSIQTWESVTDPALRARIASFSSISGPSLDHVGQWLRARLQRPTPRALVQLLSQALHSWYIVLFHLPLLAPLFWRLVGAQGWARLLRWLEGVRGEPSPTQVADGRVGIQLYRANVLPLLLRPRARPTTVPVQLIVPRADHYVRPQLFEDLHRWVPKLWRREVDAGHWQLLSQAERLADWLGAFVDQIESGQDTPALARLRQRGAPRPESGRLVVVTGAGGGIGRATALAYAEQGAALVAADINPEAAERTATLARLLGVEAHAYAVDVGDSAAMTAFADWVQTTLGVPDVVVNNAGIGMAGPIMATTPEEWERLLRVNLWSVIDGSRLFGAQMIAAGQRGHLVNVASGVAFAPSRNYPAYATSKSAVLMFTECLRAEMAAHGIGVSAICPGFVDTGITQSVRFVGMNAEEEAKRRRKVKALYQRRRLLPETVADAILRAVARNRPVALVGLEVHAAAHGWRFTPAISRAIARLDVIS